MKITKKILSMFLAIVMVLGLLPATAFATGVQEDVVYLSISYDSKYIDDKNGNPIAYVPVPLSAIAAVDLTAYEKRAFIDAVQIGAYLMLELQAK